MYNQNMLHSVTKLRNETGSSLFIVLIAVVLFAALTYAISNSSSGTNNLSLERQRIIAAEIIDQADKLADAIPRLRLNGVTPSRISFANSAVTGYTNAACTTAKCLIFDSDGGGLDWQFAPPYTTVTLNWGFTGDLDVKNLGTNAADLVAILPGIPAEICKSINQLLKQSTTAPITDTIATISANKFTGSYNGSPILITGANLDGLKAGCFAATSASGSAVNNSTLNNTYIYYQVLLAQ